MSTVVLQLQQRTDTAADWTSNDPVLAVGEFGYESDTNKLKIGNGINSWSDLVYLEERLFYSPTVFGNYYLQEDDETLDQTLWKFDPAGNKLSLKLSDDAKANELAFLEVERSGTGALLNTDSISLTADAVSLTSESLTLEYTTGGDNLRLIGDNGEILIESGGNINNVRLVGAVTDAANNGLRVDLGGVTAATIGTAGTSIVGTLDATGAITGVGVDAGAGHIDLDSTYSLRWGDSGERITGSNAASNLILYTANAAALTLDGSQNATFAGDVNVSGAFTSLGIDDNATGIIVELADTVMSLGTTGADYAVVHDVDDRLLAIAGGFASNSGANILMYGGAHATTGDMLFRNDGNVFAKWDETAGAFTVSTGVGSKTLALTLDSSQNAVFAGTAVVQGGVLDVGIQDTTAGFLQVHGAATGSNEGGELRLFTAADHDTTVNYFAVDAFTDDLRIFPNTGSFVTYFRGDTGNWEFPAAISVTGTTTLAASTVIGTWNVADTDIDGLISGSNFGSLLQGRESAHFTFALRENDSNDGFQIISGGGNYSVDPTYDTLCFEVKCTGNTTVGGTLDVSGLTETVGLHVSDAIGNGRLQITAGAVSAITNYTNNGPYIIQSEGVEAFRISQTTLNAIFAGDVTLSTATPTLNITSTQAADYKALNFSSTAGIEGVVAHNVSAEAMNISCRTSNNTDLASLIALTQSGTLNFYTGGTNGGSTTSALFIGSNQIATFADNVVVGGDKSTAAATLLVGDATLTTGAAGIELGASRTGDGTAYIDFSSDSVTSDFGTRIIRYAGANGITQHIDKGTGGFLWTTDSINALTLGSTNATFSGNVTIADANSCRWGDGNERIVASNAGTMNIIVNNVTAQSFDSSQNASFFGEVTVKDRTDIVDGGITLVIGGDTNVAGTVTNLVDKFTRVMLPHYTTAEEPMSLITAYSNATTNVLRFGGGTALGNAATSIAFYTAANNTTQTGTVALTIDSSQNATFAGDLTVSGEAKLEAYSEDANQYTATTGTRDLDVSLATYFYPSADLGTASITFTFSNPAASGRVSSFTLELLGADGATLTWPASVDWPGGAEPTWTSGVDIVSFITRDGGTTWLGFLGGLSFS